MTLSGLTLPSVVVVPIAAPVTVKVQSGTWAGAVASQLFATLPMAARRFTLVPVYIVAPEVL